MGRAIQNIIHIDIFLAHVIEINNSKTEKKVNVYDRNDTHHLG